MKKKILVILPRFPFPLDKGDKLRAFEQILFLSKKNEIYLFALSDTPIQELHKQKVTSICKEVQSFELDKFGIYTRLILNIFKKTPYQTAWHHSYKAERLLLEFYQRVKPDIIYYQLIRTANYLPEVSKHLKVLDYMDPMGKNLELRMKKEKPFMRFLLKLEANRVRKFEKQTAKDFRATTIISARDKGYLSLPQETNVHIVPNGIDLDMYTSYETEKLFDLIFVGALQYKPNIEACLFLLKEILPLCKKQFPKITSAIVGNNPDEKIKKFASDTITITGWVDDTVIYYNRSKILVAPMLINTGQQNKILEALACGVPVVTTSMANEAIGALVGHEISIADSPESFAKEIERLLTDESLYHHRKLAGLEFIKKNFSWEKSGELLEKILFP